MKIPKDSLFIFLVLNAVFITVYHVKAVQDDISQELFQSNYISLYICGQKKFRKSKVDSCPNGNMNNI